MSGSLGFSVNRRRPQETRKKPPGPGGGGCGGLGKKAVRRRRRRHRHRRRARSSDTNSIIYGSMQLSAKEEGRKDPLPLSLSLPAAGSALAFKHTFAAEVATCLAFCVCGRVAAAGREERGGLLSQRLPRIGHCQLWRSSSSTYKGATTAVHCTAASFERLFRLGARDSNCRGEHSAMPEWWAAERQALMTSNPGRVTAPR